MQDEKINRLRKIATLLSDDSDKEHAVEGSARKKDEQLADKNLNAYFDNIEKQLQSEQQRIISDRDHKESRLEQQRQQRIN